MKIFENLKSELPSNAVAIGFFDGMHKGHEAVIKKTVNEFGGGVLTFKNHPKIELGQDISLLFSYENRLKAFEGFGVKFVVALDFNKVKNLTALEFIIILENAGIKTIISGEDARIGKDMQKIAEICKKSTINHVFVPILCENGEKISSTKMRKSCKD